MNRPLTPHGDMESCTTGSLRCPRAASCWRWNKPAAERQTYADFAGGDDCAHYIGIAHDAE